MYKECTTTQREDQSGTSLSINWNSLCRIAKAYNGKEI